jgi:hypothetical protein
MLHKLNAWGNITDAYWATDREGDKGLRYTYSYGTPGAEEEGDFNELYNPVNMVSGFIKTYGLFGGGGGGMEGTLGGNDWLQNTQTVLGAFDLAHGAKEELINYAAKSSPAIDELNYVKAVRVVGKGLFAAQAGISLYQAGNAFYTNNSNKWGVAGKAGLDIAIGYISLVGGPIGWGIGAIYFIGDAAGWWGDWGQAAPDTSLDINSK